MFNKVAFGLVGILAAGLGLWFSLSLRFDFETLEGQRYRWGELQQQYVIVNYFAEWCAPCLQEIPELNKFQAFAKENPKVSLFAINYDNLSSKQLLTLQQKYAIGFPMITGQVNNAPFTIPKSLPATFIIGPDGKLIKQLNGEQSNAQLQNIIVQLAKLQGF